MGQDFYKGFLGGTNGKHRLYFTYKLPKNQSEHKKCIYSVCNKFVSNFNPTITTITVQLVAC